MGIVPEVGYRLNIRSAFGVGQGKHGMSLAINRLGCFCEIFISNGELILFETCHVSEH